MRIHATNRMFEPWRHQGPGRGFGFCCGANVKVFTACGSWIPAQISKGLDRMAGQLQHEIADVLRNRICFPNERLL